MLRIIAVGFSLLTLGCQSMPEKPIVETGQIDFPASEVLAGLSDGSDPVHREPLSSYDKAQCFKPDQWEQIKVYLKLLEDYGNRCQSERLFK